MRNDFYWGIASYNRKDKQPFLTLLNAMGYPRERIILAVQCERDYADYKARYDGMATILFREGENVCDNKNTILEYLTEHCGNPSVVMMSGKVRGIQYLTRDNQLKTIDTKGEMDGFIHKAFAVTKLAGARVFGCYPVSNKFFMSHTMQYNLQMLGCFMGIVDPSEQPFNRRYPLKEDFEYILRHVAKGNKTLRFNDVCLLATYHSKGGSYELWHADGDKVNEECTNRLLREYGNLVRRHPTRKNEIRYVGARATINKSIFEI